MTPKQQFDGNILAADYNVQMYKELRALKKLGARGSLDADNQYLLWLPRGAVVAALSSLDAFVHATLYTRLPTILSKPQGPISDQLAELVGDVMPMNKPEGARKALLLVRAKNGAALLADRLKEEKLQFLTYQTPPKIILGYRLLGVDDVFGEVAAAWPGPNTTADTIKKKLALYAKRRNQIAHEGDLDASHKARPITPNYARESIDFIRKLVTRLNDL